MPPRPYLATTCWWEEISPETPLIDLQAGPTEYFSEFLFRDFTDSRENLNTGV